MVIYKEKDSGSDQGAKPDIAKVIAVLEAAQKMLKDPSISGSEVKEYVRRELSGMRRRPSAASGGLDDDPDLFGAILPEFLKWFLIDSKKDEAESREAVESKVDQAYCSSLLERLFSKGLTISGNQFAGMAEFLYKKMNGQYKTMSGGKELDKEGFECALIEYINGVRGVEGGRYKGLTASKDAMLYIDYDRESSVKRMVLLNFLTGGVELACKVAHGSGSDPEKTGFVQNVLNQSDKSTSLRGFFFTGLTHNGDKTGFYWWGNEKGSDPKISNYLSYTDRKIIHIASYVNDDNDEISGRSNGCPAVSKDSFNALQSKGYFSTQEIKNANKVGNDIMDGNWGDYLGEKPKLMGCYVHYTADGQFGKYKSESPYLKTDFISKSEF